MDGPSGIELPGYEILEKAGEGGMATVWIARQTALERVVAVKVLAPELTRDPESVKSFQQEARAAARLRHPGIVQIHDAGEHEGHVYYIMEYVPGITVSELIERKGALTERHALTIAEGVALALQYAWEQEQLVHCDIKPDNVLIERDGAIKVTDLGLAHIVGSISRTAGGENFLGTPSYVSPEQVQGASDLDCRTDIYSLGAMLYHMVTGEMPFKGHAPKKILEKQLFGHLPDPQEVNPDLSSGVTWLIEKMMIKDRSVRSQTWDDVQTDIQEIMQGGVPAGKMPAAGQSTVLRSDKRAHEPSATQHIKASPEAIKAAAAAAKKPKQKIVLPKEMKSSLSTHTRRKKAGPGPVLARLFGLLALVGIGYGIVVYIMQAPPAEKRQADAWDTKQEKITRAEAQRSGAKLTVVKKPRRDTFQPATTPGASTRKREPKKEPQPAGDVSTVKWDNPNFIAGARAFNKGLKTFTDYQKTRSNPAILQTVEKDVRTAIAAFEACRDVAPPEVNISMYINQCYRLISDTRQSMLVAPSTGSTRTHETPRTRQRLPAPTSSLRQGTSAAAEKELALAPTWKMPVMNLSREAEDLQMLLKDYGRPEVNREPQPSLVLFEGITYLMPAKDAAAVLDARLAGRRTVTVDAFPRNCFFYYPLKVTYAGYDSALLLTDNSDRVVGVQLMNESSLNQLSFEPHNYSDHWSTYNFIQGKTKGNSKWKIGHQVERNGDLVTIESELVAYDEYGYFQLGDIKARVSLRLSGRVADLMLFHMAKARKR